VGGATDLQRLIESGELQRMRGGEEGRLGGGAGHRPAASEAALAFLGAMERRDLDHARRYLAPDFAMCFPGGHEMRRLEDLVERSRGRYRNVAKDFDRIDESANDEGAVVYCSGRLRGAWSDGREFAGIRFIDRFEVVDGLIRRQDVWNDMAEVKLSPASPSSI
jgi:hypothetical protein